MATTTATTSVPTTTDGSASATTSIPDTEGTTTPTTGPTTDATTDDSGSTGTGTTGEEAGEYNYAFVSPVTVDGELGGLAGADELCEAWADSAGIGGTYRAVLSDATIDARDRFDGARGWIRPDGRPVADTAAELFDTGPLAPLRIDPDGMDLGHVSVWSASNETGSFNTSVDGTDCGGWDDNDGANMAWYGFSDATFNWLSRGTRIACDTQQHLYCLQVDHDTPLDVDDFAETGRRMFVSSGSFDVTSGLGGADALCAADAAATAALAGGTYLAFLATDGASASSRFTTSSDTIVRPDGLRIAADFDELLAGDLVHPPNLRGDLSTESFRVVVGADGPQSPGTAAQTCSDWSDPTDANAREGFAFATLTENTERSWFGGSTSTRTCATVTETVGVYCLEE